MKYKKIKINDYDILVETDERLTKSQLNKYIYDSIIHIESKDYLEKISSFKTLKYLNKTKQGLDIIKKFEDLRDERMHVIVHRPSDDTYIIGLGYSPDDGFWNQGRYDFKSLSSAEKALKEDYDVKEFVKDEEEVEIKDSQSKGEQIAKVFAEAFKGSVGPFGGEDPELDGNELTLTSQGADEIFRFNDDGSVDFVNVKEVAEYWAIEDNLWQELEEDEYEPIQEEYAEEWSKNYSHFATVKDLLNSDLSWFIELDEEDILKKVDNILKEKIEDTFIKDGLVKEEDVEKLVDTDNYVIGKQGVWFAKPKGQIDNFVVAYASPDKGKTWYKAYMMRKTDNPSHSTQVGKVIFRVDSSFPGPKTSIGRNILTWYANHGEHEVDYSQDIDHQDNEYKNDELKNLERMSQKENRRGHLPIYHDSIKIKDVPVNSPEEKVEVTYTEKIPSGKNALTFGMIEKAYENRYLDNGKTFNIYIDVVIDSLKDDIENAEYIVSGHMESSRKLLLEDYVKIEHLVQKAGLTDKLQIIKPLVDELSEKLKLNKFKKPKFKKEKMISAAKEFRKEHRYDSIIKTTFKPEFLCSDTELKASYIDAKNGKLPQLFEVNLEKVRKDMFADYNRIMQGRDNYLEDPRIRSTLPAIVAYYEKAINFADDLGYDDYVKQFELMLNTIKKGWAME